MARVKAAMRRSDILRFTSEEEDYVSVEGLEVDKKRREVALDGAPRTYPDRIRPAVAAGQQPGSGLYPQGHRQASLGLR